MIPNITAVLILVKISDLEVDAFFTIVVYSKNFNLISFNRDRVEVEMLKVM